MSGPTPLERDWVGLSEAQEFGIAYETDDFVALGDLVALPSTENRRSTVSDTPSCLASTARLSRSCRCWVPRDGRDAQHRCLGEGVHGAGAQPTRLRDPSLFISDTTRSAR